MMPAIGLSVIAHCHRSGTMRLGKDDRCREHPELDEERQRVTDVAILHRERRKEHARHPARGSSSAPRAAAGPTAWRCGGTPYQTIRSAEHTETDDEIHERRQRGRGRDDHAREIHLGDEVRAGHDAGGAVGHGVREERPRQQPRKGEQRIRDRRRARRTSRPNTSVKISIGAMG